jgi:hypothetical protein
MATGSTKGRFWLQRASKSPACLQTLSHHAREFALPGGTISREGVGQGHVLYQGEAAELREAATQCQRLKASQSAYPAECHAEAEEG